MERDIAKVKVQSIHAGVMAPDFEATTLDGKPFKLSDLRGKVVLIDFWATWCVPCVSELPNVKKLYEKFGGDNFVVVGISFDRDAATAQKFVTSRQLPWIQIWAEKADDGPIANLYGVGGIPATFLIGPDGKVIERDLHGEELATAVGRETRKVAGGGGPPTDGNSFAAKLLSGLFKKAAEALPPSLPDESPEARAVLDATVARYQALKSYRDNYRYEARLEQKDEPPQEGQIDGTFAWADDRIAVKSDVQHLYCDGRQITRYWPSARRYMSAEMYGSLAETLHNPEWSPFGRAGGGEHPLALLLASGDDAAEHLPILVVTDVQPGTREGRPGRVLSGRFRVDGLEQAEALPFEAFIDDERQLFEEFRLDYTRGYRAALCDSHEADPDGVERAEIVITLDDVELDTQIPDDAFVLNEPGAQKYDMYASGRGADIAQPEDLLGHAAPALTGTTFDSSQFDLSAEEGKVVVVAFWATWAPQAETVLREVQNLAATSTANVCIVGVNRNGPGGEAIARQTMECCGVQYPQVSDGDGEMAEAWNVVCLPLIYVVDTEGRVSTAYSSWTDDTPPALADCVAKLAAGQALAADASADAPRGSDDAGGLTLKMDGEPVGEERVSVEQTVRVSGSAWNMSEQDVDGDGEVEFIFPEYEGSLTILKPSTGDVQRVCLSGLAGANVRSVHAVQVDGDICWLCSATRYNFFGGGGSERTLLCLYSPRGELLWRFQPAVKAGIDSQAHAVGGDLDGDGRVEYVLGLTMYERSQTDENSYTITAMHGRLIWLEDTGQVIAERELASQVEMLHVVPGRPGEPATVLCLAGGQLERYRLSPETPAEGAGAAAP